MEKQPRPVGHGGASAGRRRRRGRRLRLDRLAGGLARTFDQALEAESVALGEGFLQRLDPRTKVVGLLALVLLAVMAQSLAVILAVLAVALALAMTSGVTPARMALQVWLPVLAFTGLVALPAAVTVPGTPVLAVPILGWPVTKQGLRSAALLVGRGEAASSLALLLVLCTPWTHILKALRLFGVPPVLVVILGMTHRYIFVLLGTAIAMFEARRARTVGRMTAQDGRRLATATAGTLFAKAFAMSSDVHLAMISRGYRGEVRVMDDFRFRKLDWIVLACLVALAALALWAGS